MLVSALGSRSKGRQIKSRYLRAQFCNFTAFTYLTLLTEFLVNHNFTESWPYDQPRLIERKSILALEKVQESPIIPSLGRDNIHYSWPRPVIMDIITPLSNSTTQISLASAY